MFKNNLRIPADFGVIDLDLEYGESFTSRSPECLFMLYVTCMSGYDLL